MNVCSLELSKQLFELSGWDDTDYSHLGGTNRTTHYTQTDIPTGYIHIPAYDLGFILWKLPKQIKHVGGSPAGVHFNLKQGQWQTSFTLIKAGTDDQYKTYDFFANTPEDAAAMLAIALFQQGILKRKGEK